MGAGASEGEEGELAPTPGGACEGGWGPHGGGLDEGLVAAGDEAVPPVTDEAVPPIAAAGGGTGPADGVAAAVVAGGPAGALALAGDDAAVDADGELGELRDTTAGQGKRVEGICELNRWGWMW